MRSVPNTLGPSLRHSVDVDRFLQACPPGATTQGTFLQYIRDAVVQRKGGMPPELLQGIPRDRWLPFLKYPLRELMQLIVNAGRILHPTEPTAEALRRIGWFAYPSFAATMAGRIVLFAFGESLNDVVRSVPKVYSITVPGSIVSLRSQASRGFHLEFRGVYCFVDTYHRGVIEGAIWAHGFEPVLKVTSGERFSDADMFADW